MDANLQAFMTQYSQGNAGAAAAMLRATVSGAKREREESNANDAVAAKKAKVASTSTALVAAGPPRPPSAPHEAPATLKPAPYFFYRDFSSLPDPNPSVPLTTAGHVPSFPAKMHAILSRPDLADVISWMPHGRSWKVWKPREFEIRVIPTYFEHSKFSSFIRQSNGWGFRRITKGKDRNSYYHEMFLRGLPHLAKMMKRPRASEKPASDPNTEPDLYKISEEHPVPEAKSEEAESILAQCNIPRGTYGGQLITDRSQKPELAARAQPKSQPSLPPRSMLHQIKPAAIAARPQATASANNGEKFMSLEAMQFMALQRMAAAMKNGEQLSPKDMIPFSSHGKLSQPTETVHKAGPHGVFQQAASPEQEKHQPVAHHYHQHQSHHPIRRVSQAGQPIAPSGPNNYASMHSHTMKTHHFETMPPAQPGSLQYNHPPIRHFDQLPNFEHEGQQEPLAPIGLDETEAFFHPVEQSPEARSLSRPCSIGSFGSFGSLGAIGSFKLNDTKSRSSSAFPSSPTSCNAVFDTIPSPGVRKVSVIRSPLVEETAQDLVEKPASPQHEILRGEADPFPLPEGEEHLFIPQSLDLGF